MLPNSTAGSSYRSSFRDSRNTDRPRGRSPCSSLLCEIGADATQPEIGGTCSGVGEEGIFDTTEAELRHDNNEPATGVIMELHNQEQLTILLHAVENGDGRARERLWQAVYEQVYRLAQSQIAHDKLRNTLQPTALVHEAYLRLMAGHEVHWSNRRHFFAAVAEALRRIRVDYARKRESLKRGGGVLTAELRHEPIADEPDPAELLAVNDALTRFEKVDAARAEVVRLRYFAGLSVDETADVLGISPRTVDNHWRVARTWLYRALNEEGSTGHLRD